MKKLEEENWFGTFQGLRVLDAGHAIERLHERLPELDDSVFFQKLDEGIEKINRVFHGNDGYYMIISFSTDLKIQFQKRPDMKNPEESIGIVATVLNRKEHIHNTQNDQDVYVEHIIDEFNQKPSNFTKSDKLINLFEDFIYVEVE